MQIYLEGRCKANVCVVLREFNPTVSLSINKLERVEPLCAHREISVDIIRRCSDYPLVCKRFQYFTFVHIHCDSEIIQVF